MALVPIRFGITGTEALLDYQGTGARPTRSQATCYIVVGGRDMTAAWDPRLETVTVLDVTSGMDEAVIELDDGEGKFASGNYAGRMPLPQPGQPVGIALGWPQEGAYRTFTGYIWDLETLGQRRSGRRLRIECKGAMATGKQRRSNYWGEGEPPAEAGGGAAQAPGGITLGQVMQDAGKADGYTVNVDPKLAQIKEPYWDRNKESFHQFGERIARQYGGIFKVQGKTAAIVAADGTTNALGQAMTSVRASSGFNLLAWRLKPLVARPVYGATKAQWFDKKSATYKTENGVVTGHGDGPWGSAKEVFNELWDFAGPNGAASQASADGIHSNRARGEGWIVIDGEPQAAAQGKCILAGARPGADGQWTIDQVEHQYGRSTGFTTRLDVVEPNVGGPGSDFWDPAGRGETAPQVGQGPRGDQ